MKLWLVERSDMQAVDYDEYDSFVIAAETDYEARDIAQDRERHAKGWIATQIAARTTCARGVVLGSFNAG